MPESDHVPLLTVPFKVCHCPDCGRTFEPDVLYCPVCERPTRLDSPLRDYIVELGAP